MTDKYAVYSEDTGELLFIISKEFVAKYKAEDKLSKLKQVYRTKGQLYKLIEEEKDPELLRAFAEDVTECEYELQRIYGFVLNKDYHRFWETPKCLCPIQDNLDRYPSDNYVYSQQCTLHGLAEFKRSLKNQQLESVFGKLANFFRGNF